MEFRQRASVPASAPPRAGPVLGQRLALRRAPLCPELELWLVGDDVDLEQACPELLELSAPPFWAFAWASGQALARFLLDEPEIVRGRRVADFGSGCGIAALAAARAGAARVVAVDIDPDARVAAACNARHNGLRLDVADALPEDAEVVLAADVAYEPGNFGRLNACAQHGTEVWIADPGRAGTPPIPLQPLRHFEARTFPDVDPPLRSVALYRVG